MSRSPAEDPQDPAPPGRAADGGTPHTGDGRARLNRLEAQSLSAWGGAIEAYAFHHASRLGRRDAADAGGVSASVRRFFQTLGPMTVGKALGDVERDRQVRIVEEVVGPGSPRRTSLLQLLRRRRSARDFAPDGPLLPADAFWALMAAVGDHHGRRVIPSAGGLETLAVWVLVRRSESVAPGLYRLMGQNRLLRVGPPPPTDRLKTVVGERESASDASLVIWLGANLTRPLQKYGNRGYRMGLLEVGAAMYALSLMAVRLGLRHFISESFQDRAVEDWLDVKPPYETVLVQVLVGEGSEP
jgi:SagB-type dehydrogenase family enzyme